MKHLVLVGDGMADYPLPDHGDRTPLELAQTSAMDAAVQCGLTGLFWPIPEDLPPGSDIGNLSLFGYDPHTTFTGRAPLEAANQGIALAPDEVAFRCNLVTLHDDLMADFTAGHITTEEASELIGALNAALGDAYGATFHTGVSYRHLTILGSRDAADGGYADLSCTPPHDITAQSYAPHLPQGPGEGFIRELMERSVAVLAAHPVNAARKAPATSIWLWGQGRAPKMETYAARFGLTGAVISAVDLINGIGRTAGFEVIDVPGVTGYLDTNYDGKVSAALDALDRVDVVYVHVEAPDEASHEGKLDLKIRAIEDFDARVVAPCLQAIQERGDTRLFVAPDHVTALSTRTHAPGPVPFIICGAGVSADGAAAYSEAVGKAALLEIPAGSALVPYMLTHEECGTSALKVLS